MVSVWKDASSSRRARPRARSAATDALAAGNLSPRFYGRVQLTDERGQPFPLAKLVAGRNYIFHYPFEATPCFLLNLGKADRQQRGAEDGGRLRLPVAGRRRPEPLGRRLSPRSARTA